MPGIWTSIRITANVRFITARSAASPESASTIAWPSGSRTATIDSRLAALSSTTRIAAAGGRAATRLVDGRRQTALTRCVPARRGGNQSARAASSSAVSTGLGM